jgi:hypothetical protein
MPLAVTFPVRKSPAVSIASRRQVATSLVRPVLITPSPDLLGRRVGQLAEDDLRQLDMMLKRALGLE